MRLFEESRLYTFEGDATRRVFEVIRSLLSPEDHPPEEGVIEFVERNGHEDVRITAHRNEIFIARLPNHKIEYVKILRDQYDLRPLSIVEKCLDEKSNRATVRGTLFHRMANGLQTSDQVNTIQHCVLIDAAILKEAVQMVSQMVDKLTSPYRPAAQYAQQDQPTRQGPTT